MSKRHAKPLLSGEQWRKRLLGNRSFPVTAPLDFTFVAPSQPPELTLAPGVQLIIGPKELEQRFRHEPVKAFFARYRQAGGDTRRLETLLTCLLPVTVPRPPTQTTLKRKVQEAHRALGALLRLPGTLPGREVFEKAADTLRLLDERDWVAYLTQFKPDKPTLFNVEMRAPGFEEWSYPKTHVPPIGATRRGRIHSGSPTGLVIGVLAELCRRRQFETPWWPAILAVCQAIAPETFDYRDTPERLQKRVASVPKEKIAFLYGKLFPTD